MHAIKQIMLVECRTGGGAQGRGFETQFLRSAHRAAAFSPAAVLAGARTAIVAPLITTVIPAVVAPFGTRPTRRAGIAARARATRIIITAGAARRARVAVAGGLGKAGLAAGLGAARRAGIVIVTTGIARGGAGAGASGAATAGAAFATGATGFRGGGSVSHLRTFVQTQDFRQRIERMKTHVRLALTGAI
ncbi:hypothetical protein GCM10011317_30930 [Niveispirillum cyanobacteriorum]|nr:hypothetical protein GCM10011317_30930 [Niveispirillum cyanobacteriorum]